MVTTPLFHCRRHGFDLVGEQRFRKPHTWAGQTNKQINKIKIHTNKLSSSKIGLPSGDGVSAGSGRRTTAPPASCSDPLLTLRLITCMTDISITDQLSTTEPVGPGATVKRSNERERGRCHRLWEQEN